MRLRVGRARATDIGAGTARLGPGAFTQLGLSVGDVIELVGKRRTTAIALRLGFEDRGLDIIRIEGLVRANAGAVIGEDVEVRRAAVRDARRVALVHAVTQVSDAFGRERGPVEAIRRTLTGRVVSVGDLTVVAWPREEGANSAPVTAAGWAVRMEDTGCMPVQAQCRVASTEPEGNVRILPTTEIELIADVAAHTGVARIGATYDDVGGLADVIAQLRETVELPLARPDLFRQLGIAPPRGVLLHGPPGSGKTLLASAVAGESGARLFVLDSAAFADDRHASAFEQKLADVFEHARAQAPAIVLLKGLDTIAPARDVRGGFDRRYVAQLLAHIDNAGSVPGVSIIGTALTADAVDEAVRQAGCFDREVAVGVLDQVGRREVLAIHARHVPLAADVDLDRLSRITVGFTGGDVGALLREAGVATLRRVVAAGAYAEAGSTPGRPLQVSHQDFEDALARVRPAALREHAIAIPAVRWADIGGLDDVKRALRDGIELPLENADAFARLGIRAAKGFLLFGPPGTGKTMLARAVAHESGATFIAVKPSDLLSKWYGESERQVAQLFARARHLAPTILFFDEIEALLPRRGAGAGEPAVTDRVVNAILMELDGLEELRGVVAIGATNQPALVEPALLRPGRMDELIYVPAPNDDERAHILQVLTTRVPLARDVDLRALARRTTGFTGADLEGLVRRAGFRAFCENAGAREVASAHFEKALGESRASVTPAMEREFNTMVETLRLDGTTRRDVIGFSR